MGEVFTIPPQVPFLESLARGLLDEAGDDEWASDVLVLLPTRRACRGLRDAFLEEARGRALILPRIQSIGDVDADELFVVAEQDALLPPAIGRTRRLLLLARLLEAHDPEMPVEHRLSLAHELAALLDELASERKSLAALRDLVPDHLAAHYQVTRALLELIDRAWPQILAEEQALDPADRRNRVLDGFASRLAAGEVDRRIVVAGTTGSIAATRRLLRVVVGQRRGAIVLPGLDLSLDEAAWRGLPPGHPQAGLKQLLDALERPRNTIRTWPAAADAQPASTPVRVALTREAIRPAAPDGPGTDIDPEIFASGCHGLELMELPDQRHEAAAIALRMRAALEDPGARAMLVTADRGLARQVTVELRRWGIEADDSAGIPLGLTMLGALLLLSAELLRGVTSVGLLALLKHPLVLLRRTDGEVRRDATRLERQALRGPRISGGLAGILTELRRLDAECARDRPGQAGRYRRSLGVVERFTDAARPFLELAGRASVELDQLVERHLAFVEALVAPASGSSELWAGEAGEAAQALVLDLRDAARRGHPLEPLSYPTLLAQLMAERPVRSRLPSHPRLRIYGQLEARLQHADHVVIGGLNEGVWPSAIDAGPWLNRSMRQSIGLPPQERRVGLAAHDLAQLLSAPRVVLARAERDAAGNPTVPSRWLVRLKTLLGSHQSAGQSWYPYWAASLDQPRAEGSPVMQPRPAPAVHARPRDLSVSDIGLWMRDPYALYAKRILKLRPLAPLEQEPGALERGIMIHGILERFVSEHPDQLPHDAWTRLTQLGRQAFAAYAHRPLVAALWWPRFEQAARWYLEMEQDRRDGILTLHVEAPGSMTLDRPGGRFVLRARADRIERGRDGRLVIIDYKTGAIPKPADVAGGREPQLPLEAAILEAAAFDDVAPGPIAGLWFWSIRGDSAGGRAEQVKGDASDLARAASDGLRQLVDHYDDPATCYPARLRPDMSFVRDYDHLARFKEWAG